VQKDIDCFNDGTDIRFRTSSPNSGSTSFIGQLPGKMNRHQQNGDFWKKLCDLPGYVKPIEVGHLKVQQNHIRRIFPNPLNGLSTGASFVTYLPGALLLEKPPKIVANRRVVVYHQNSHQAVFPSPRIASIMTPAGLLTYSY
jgi:hypothetical protein